MTRTEMQKEIEKEADALEEALIALRRDLHRYPEPGWMEVRTSALIARKLTELGYEVLTGEEVCKKEARMGVPPLEELERAYERALSQGADPEFAQRARLGQTGVIGILHCGPGPVVGLRFDIDALGVTEMQEEGHRPYREGFASENAGIMHACGHDGHTAIGLGTAAVLAKLRRELRGTVKLFFQPAEEGVRGAKSMVEQGHLRDVQYFLGAHLADEATEGEGSQLRPGYEGGLATTKYDVVFHGKAAHAAVCPQEGSNAILAAAAAIQNLYAIPRHSQGNSLVNVGTIHGGSGRNVVPDEVKLEMEVRGETTEIHEYMKKRALAVLDGAAAMYGVTCEIQVMGGAASLTASPGLSERVGALAREQLHLRVSAYKKLADVGSEDVSEMMREVQEHGGEATFLRLYTGTAGPFHSRSFDFDERVLARGVRVFCSLVYDLSSGS